MAKFAITMTAEFSDESWAAAYGDRLLTAEGVAEWLQAGLFVGSDRVAVSVGQVLSDDGDDEWRQE